MARRIKTILFSPIGLSNTIDYILLTPIRTFTEARGYRRLSETGLYMKRDCFKISQRDSIKKLEELLSFRPFVAREIVLTYKNFLKISGNNIGENFYLCKNNGVTIDTLRNFPLVLAESDLPFKVKELKTLPYDINITTPLLLLSYNKLKEFTTNEIEIKRILVISKLLEIEERDVCKHLILKPFLLSLSLKQLQNTISLLTDSGITKEDIVRDLWVLRYSSSVIEEKILLAKENNIETFKTWMVRAQRDIFDKYIKRRSDTKSILGNNSLAGYLSERLECTEEMAKYLITKQPALQNKSLTKMNEMIDFLFKNGFQPIHIRRVPKILMHSVETTKKRLKELEAKGKQLDTLHILTKSQKQYMQYYESLKTIN